jgi:biopolymer transport protein ExbB/TolQ
VIANFPPLALTGPANSGADLGRGDDLNPPLSRWLSIGGISGFVLWALAAPPAVPLHAFLHQRGPTQVVCLVFAGMVVAFLVAKGRLLQAEQQRLQQLDLDVPGLVASGDLDAIGRRAEQSASLAGKRLLRVLAVWQSTQSSFQLERSVDGDAELYELAQERSYSLAKVLMWAIPILGFIGTVIGMSQAVGSFDAVLGNSDNVDGLKAGLTKVTSGLGTAFDTTYLALVISVLLSFPMIYMERQEEQLLNGVDGEVRALVMALSPSGESAGGAGGGGVGGGLSGARGVQAPGPLDLQGDELSELINGAFEQFLPDPSVLVAPAQRYADQLTEATLTKLEPLTQVVRDAVEGVAEARLSLQEQAHQIRSSMDGVAADLNQSVRDLDPLLRELQAASKLSTVLGEDLDQLKATVELRRAIEALNANLQELTQERQRRRGPGWWRRLHAALLR